MLWSQYVNIIHLALLSQPLPSSLKISKQVTSASLATFIVTNYDSWTSDLASSQPRDHLDRIRNNYRNPSKIYGPGIFHHESPPIFFLQTIGELQYSGQCLVEVVGDDFGSQFFTLGLAQSFSSVAF